MELTEKEIQDVLKAIDNVIKSMSTVTEEKPVIETKTTVSGIVAEYNVLNDHKHTFLHGAFTEAIEKSSKVPLLFQHKDHLQAGEVEMFISKEKGLYISAELFDNPVGRDMKRLIDAGLLDSFSLGYQYNHVTNHINDHGFRTIHTVYAIDEVSLVTQPAAPGAIMEGVNKNRRESNVDEYFKRLGRFWKVDQRLEVKEIYDIIKKEWSDTYKQTSEY